MSKFKKNEDDRGLIVLLNTLINLSLHLENLG